MIELYTVKEVAKILKVDTSTVYEYIRNGSLTSIRMGEKQTLRIHAADLNKFVGGNNATDNNVTN